MNSLSLGKQPIHLTRRHLLLLPLVLIAEQALAKSSHHKSSAQANSAPSSTLPSGVCPLNSGGPSLLGTQWTLVSIYGNNIPKELEITMEVGEDILSGFAGCNKYTANFKKVGHTGFMMTDIEKGEDGCPVIKPEPGSPTINVGNWEGNYLRTLRRAGSVQQEDNILHFFNRSGEASVIFHKRLAEV